MSRIASSLAGWRDQARKYKIAEREIAMMAESIESRLQALADADRNSG